MAAFKEYAHFDGLGLAELIARKEVSLGEVFEASLEVINKVNPVINAVVGGVVAHDPSPVPPRGTLGPLYGVPFLLKDLAALAEGTVTTFGCRLFSDVVADHDSEVVVRYKRAGVVLLGKSNTSEMGLTATTEPLLFGPTRNPWDITRSAGGSSGGAGAAVAAGIVPCAHSTDGGGSTRIPASCCGLFGLKPTRARTSLAPDAGERNGAFFTHHAITRSVRDSAALLDVVAGPGLGDPYWAPPAAQPFLKEVGAPVGQLQIALQATPVGGGPVAPECRDAALKAARLCESLGHKVDEAIPSYSLETLVTAARTIWSANLHAVVLARCTSMGQSPHPEMMEPLTWQLFQLGGQLTASQYVQAIDAVHKEGRKIARFLERYDVLLTPTLASPPLPLGEINPASVTTMEEADSLFARQFNGYTPFTMVANAAGNPAMSVPLAWSTDGLPIGVQFLARYGDEALLIRLAAQLEAAQPWFDKRPPLTSKLFTLE